MRKFAPVLAALALLTVAAPVLGNGFGGDSPPSRIPIPARPFTATVEDSGGTTVDVSSVTWNGEVFLYGELGEGQITVPFEKVDYATVKLHTNEKVLVTAMMHDTTSVTFTVDEDLLCYGKTVFGNYQIEVSKLRRIDFPTPPPKAPAAKK